MNPMSEMRLVLRELANHAEAVFRAQTHGQRNASRDMIDLQFSILKARKVLGEFASGKPIAATDPIDTITTEDVFGQILRLLEAKEGRGSGIPAALILQNEEARAETRRFALEAVEKMREHERYLRNARDGVNGQPPNPRAFFFEG